MRSVVDFVVEKDAENSELRVSCLEGGMKQSYEGNPFFANILSKLVPNVRSTNVFKFERSTCELSNTAVLEIEFFLPNWFPLAAEPVEKVGSYSYYIKFYPTPFLLNCSLLK